MAVGAGISCVSSRKTVSCCRLSFSVSAKAWFPVKFPLQIFVLMHLFVDVCERPYPRFWFGYLLRFFYFHLQSCRRKLNFSREGGKLLIFHSVMYSSAQNDDAKLAIRGQTSADSKCFLLRKPSLFLGTSFVILC